MMYLFDILGMLMCVVAIVMFACVKSTDEKYGAKL